MSVKMRKYVERAIVSTAIDELLATGFKLGVDNGGDGLEIIASGGEPHTSRNKEIILAHAEIAKWTD